MMDEDHRGFETTREDAPTFHSERSHALWLTMRVQCLYSQIKDLFIRLTEKCGLGPPTTGDWRALPSFSPPSRTSPTVIEAPPVRTTIERCVEAFRHPATILH